jgi:signal transduction histidine kinase/ligand-binding sensor domain-containing protein
MSCLKQILLVNLMVLTGYFATGQGIQRSVFKRCPVKTINVEQGLLDNATTNIITDRLGLTWVSTITGLQRFNGYTLERINPVIGGETIPIDYPVRFFQRKDHSIWISYKFGILSYDPLSNAFKKIILLPTTQNSFYPLIPLKETAGGTWCMQEKAGIVFYDKKMLRTHELSATRTPEVDSILLASEFLYRTVSAANDHFIFLLTGDNRVLEVNMQTDQCSWLGGFRGKVCGIDCNDTKLYVVSTQALSCLNLETGTISKRFLFPDFVNESAVRLAGGNQLLVSAGKNLYEFDTACEYQKEFTTLDRSPLLPTGFIQIIYTDPFKRIWLLTNDNIKRIQNVDIPFEYFLYPNEKNNFVRSLYYDEQKHVLLAGCFNGGVQLYDELAHPLWSQPLMTAEVKDVIGIEKLTGEDYLIVTFNKGWWVLHLPSRELRLLRLTGAMKTQIGSRQMIFSDNLIRTGDSTMFIATSLNAFRCRFSGSNLVSAQPMLNLAGLTTAITCLFYSSDKTLWAGTQSGSFFRAEEGKPVQTIEIPEKYPIRCIAEDAMNHVWIGTDKGALVYTLSGRLLNKITRETGLLNDCIYALLPGGEDGSVFASTNLGLSRILADGTIRNYPKELGLQENEFNSGSAVRTNRGKLFFGGVNGITAFYPSALSIIGDTPVLNITRLVVNDSLFNSSSGIWWGDSILLDHFQNHLQIDFAALGLLNTNEYLYRYRLKGFENSWQLTHQPVGIRYILQPGKYELQISCSPILSSHASFSKNVFIRIYPPWWQSWWFRTLALIALITLIAGVVFFYNRRRYRQKIKALQLQHEIQLERERISKDLHDNLGAYASAISTLADEIAMRPSALQGDTLASLKSNASEIIVNLRDSIWTLNKESITLTDISDRFKGYMQKIKPAYPGIQVILGEQIEGEPSLSPTQALNIYRIMQEAFHNAIRHSHAELIRIGISGGPRLSISIEDNGKGIGQTISKGNGLLNMKSRAKESGLNLEIGNVEGGGTRVILSN